MYPIGAAIRTGVALYLQVYDFPPAGQLFSCSSIRKVTVAVQAGPLPYSPTLASRAEEN